MGLELSRRGRQPATYRCAYALQHVGELQDVVGVGKAQAAVACAVDGGDGQRGRVWDAVCGGVT